MWRFFKQRVGTPERNPQELELFSSKQDWSGSIVRESIQNSMDAMLPNFDSIKISFSIFDQPENSLNNELENHALSANSNLIKGTKKKINCLVIEDFNTSGLDGSFSGSPNDKNNKNYYNFWFREGKSDKKDSSRGRWGIGKIVYHGASELRAFFGLSVRAEDRKSVLLGKAILGAHSYKNENFDYFSYYSNDDKNTPYIDSWHINEFKDKYKLQRNSEPGLSIIIPYLRDDITIDSLKRSIIQNFFYPILIGKLTIELISDNQHLEIKSDNLSKVTKSIKDLEFKDFSVIYSFFEEFKTIETFNNLYVLDSNSEIEAVSFENLKNEYSNNLLEGSIIPIKLIFKIYYKDESIKDTYVKIYLKKANNLDKPYEFYFRNGLKIEPKKASKNSFLSAMIIEDKLISEFLGDAETPAHNDWSERSDKLKIKYRHHGNTLRLIKNAISNIISKLVELKEDEKDFNLLGGIFPNKSGGNKKVLGSEDGVTETVPAPPNSDLFTVNKGAQGELTIYIISEDKELPYILQFNFAYDTAKGNPFKKWNKHDFDLTNMEINDFMTGEIYYKGENKLIFKVENENAKVKIYGFDKNRDLKISAIIQDEIKTR